MSDSELFFSKIDHFDSNLIANIQGGVIICQFDPETGLSKAIYLSEGWTALTGYTLEELNEKFDGNPLALVYPEDGARCNQDYIEQTSKDNRYQLEYRCCHKDGSLFWVIDRGIITSTAEGYNQNQSIITNINPIKENEEKLRMSEARFRIAINASNAAVFEFDLNQKNYLTIDNAAVVFRADEETIISDFEAIRMRTPDIQMKDVFQAWFHPDDVPLLLHSYEGMLRGKVGESEVRLRQPNGSYIWCQLHYAMVEDSHGNPIRVIGHLVDIEEQHKRTERLLIEAQSDALTGLYNKTAIQELVENTLKTTPHVAHALFMLDIDNFKGVNDQLGHLFGDAVLMDVSAKLKRLFRRDGVVGRIGGDEFIVLLQNECSAEDMVNRAETICNAFRHTYSGEKNDYKISCSVGIAFSTAEDSFETLFQKSDLALYKAKSLGKDQYVVYTEQLSQNIPFKAIRINQNDNFDSGKLKIKERIFELLYDSVDFSGSVNMILALLGQLLETSHIYIFENTQDNRFAESIYEWSAEGKTSFSITEKQRLPVAELDYYAQFDGDGIFNCRDIATLPKHLYELYANSGVLGTFQVAIVADNMIQGFMRYDSSNLASVPTREQVEIMIFAAKVTGTFIIRKRADESIKMFNQNKMDALDHMPSGIYVIDEDYRLQYVNNMVQSIYPKVKLGQMCHKVFMKNDAPCENCPALGDLTESRSTELYNPNSKMWMIANASPIRWSGCDHMKLICCQIITQYKITE